jgi:SNF2 family DNA or RNA helicase
MVAPIIDRRRKTDPDIMAQFPKKTEQSLIVEMGPEQSELYELLESLQDNPEDPREPVLVDGLWTLLRMAAGHPAAIPLAARNGSSKVAKMLVEELGEDYFTTISSAKANELLIRLEHVVKEQGQKAVVFTFFGQTILPVLAKMLRDKKFKVYTNHGGMSESEQAESRLAFRADPEPCIFLTSDAGSRGINLPEATHVYEFESALTYANRTQRIDRIHRITSTSPTITCTTLVTNRTVEAAIIEKMSQRNEQSDLLLGDDDAGEGFMTAADRRAALNIHRISKSRRKSR